MRLGLAPRSLTIRPLRRRDLRAVMDIERISYPKPWSEAVFRGELDRVHTYGDRTYLAAASGRTLAGYAGLMFAVDDAHVTNIAVAPAHQRGGVGRRLLAELAWAARDRGALSMTLEVRVSNVAAQRLYESFGFTTAGIRKNYYEDVEDALVMWRHGVQEAGFAALLGTLAPEARP